MSATVSSTFSRRFRRVAGGLASVSRLDDRYLRIIASTPMTAETGVMEYRMSAAVSSTFSRRFRRVAAGLAASLALGALSAHAAPAPFPADFRSSKVMNADATINVRVGGHGPAVVLIHGF